MEKEPIDYLFNIIDWVFFTPLELTEKSKVKSVRVVGSLLCIPFAITWIITGIPMLICMLIFLIAQLFYE